MEAKTKGNLLTLYHLENGRQNGGDGGIITFFLVNISQLCDLPDKFSYSVQFPGTYRSRFYMTVNSVKTMKNIVLAKICPTDAHGHNGEMLMIYINVH